MTTDSQWTTAWQRRVAEYLDSLQNCIETISHSLFDIRDATAAMVLPELNRGQNQLVEAMSDLERLIAVRQELLGAEDAPARGLSLRDVLADVGDAASLELAQRCKQLSRDIELTRERAVAVFVCQFHLSDLSEHLLTLLRGGSRGGTTYDNSGSTRRAAASGGSLLNQSA